MEGHDRGSTDHLKVEVWSAVWSQTSVKVTGVIEQALLFGMKL